MSITESSRKLRTTTERLTISLGTEDSLSVQPRAVTEVLHMKNIFKRIISLFLSLCMIFVLCACSACRWVPYCTTFIIKNIPDDFSEDFFTSESFEFTRINDVVFKPCVYSGVNRNHDRGFHMDLDVYSRTCEEKVVIKRIRVEDEDMTSVCIEINEEASFEINENQIYEWCYPSKNDEYIEVFFSEEYVNLSNGNVFNVVIEVTVTNGDSTVETSLRYEVEVFVQSGPAWLHV